MVVTHSLCSSMSGHSYYLVHSLIHPTKSYWSLGSRRTLMGGTRQEGNAKMLITESMFKELNKGQCSCPLWMKCDGLSQSSSERKCLAHASWWRNRYFDLLFCLDQDGQSSFRNWWHHPGQACWPNHARLADIKKLGRSKEKQWTAGERWKRKTWSPYHLGLLSFMFVSALGCLDKHLANMLVRVVLIRRKPQGRAAVWHPHSWLYA